jgi:hypothetical protein
MVVRSPINAVREAHRLRGYWVGAQLHVNASDGPSRYANTYSFQFVLGVIAQVLTSAGFQPRELLFVALQIGVEERRR